MDLNADLERAATGERLAFLALTRQLATPTHLNPVPTWRPATFATDEGLLQGHLAGLSEDERTFRATDLATPIGVYSKAQLRDTDVLFARFTLSAAEVQEIRDARCSVAAAAASAPAAAPPAAASDSAPETAAAGAPLLSSRAPHQLNSKDDDDSSNDSDGCDAIGFMFDAETARSKVHFSFPVRDVEGGSCSESATLDIPLLCIDDNPGAVQSGHYVWPAASALARHLADMWASDEYATTSTVKKAGGSPGGGPIAVVELGAGCGLAGLAALRLGCTTVVFTDHDAGTLDLIRDNVELQGLDLSHTHVFTCPLAWGAAHRGDWPSQVTSQTDAGGGFDLVLASDVIYDSGVVEPLLWTVRHLLAPLGKALLCGSFRLEGGTDEQMDSICASLGMACVTVYDDLDTGGCRLQEIRLSA
jgi:hypothetical protein